MRRNTYRFLLVAFTLIFAAFLVSCGGGTQPTAEPTSPPAAEEEAQPTEPPAEEPTEAPAEPTATVAEEGETGGEAMGGEAVEQVAIVLPASQTDQGWNQQGADSLRAVGDELGVQVEVAENQGYGDITPVLRDLADRGFGLIICHASGYQTVCPEFAQETDTKVAVIENEAAVTEGLISDIETQAQEVAYLAGVLAAEMTQSGTVGIVTSGEPPTWNFMTVGFAEGVKATNSDVEVLYSVIGDAAYEDAAGAKRVTESELAAGADIIFGMGDGASFGMIQAIQEHNQSADNQAWFIDVIGDKSAEYGDVLLTSVLFDYSNVYTQMIEDIGSGSFGKTYTMDVESGGVRLLDLPDAVPAEAVQAVDDARQAILDGDIQVSAIGGAEEMQARLDELQSQ